MIVPREIQELHADLAADLDQIRRRFGSVMPNITLIVRSPDKFEAMAVVQADGEELDSALASAEALAARYGL